MILWNQMRQGLRLTYTEFQCLNPEDFCVVAHLQNLESDNGDNAGMDSEADVQDAYAQMRDAINPKTG